MKISEKMGEKSGSNIVYIIHEICDMKHYETYNKPSTRWCNIVVFSVQPDLTIITCLLWAVQKWLQEGHCFIGEVEGVGNVSPQTAVHRRSQCTISSKVKNETSCQGFPRVCHVVSCNV